MVAGQWPMSPPAVNSWPSSAPTAPLPSAGNAGARAKRRSDRRRARRKTRRSSTRRGTMPKPPTLSPSTNDQCRSCIPAAPPAGTSAVAAADTPTRRKRLHTARPIESAANHGAEPDDVDAAFAMARRRPLPASARTVQQTAMHQFDGLEANRRRAGMQLGPGPLHRTGVAERPDRGPPAIRRP